MGNSKVPPAIPKCHPSISDTFSQRRNVCLAETFKKMFHQDTVISVSVHFMGGLTRCFAPRPQVVGSDQVEWIHWFPREVKLKIFLPLSGFSLPSHLENILPLPWGSGGNCDSPLRRRAVCQTSEWTSATLGGLVNQRPGLVLSF